MCAAWKKNNEKNEIVCFYCTQPDILLWGIARFSRGNKNKLRTFQPQKLKINKNSHPQTKFTGSYKKEDCNWTEQVELNRIILPNVVIFIEAVTNTCSVKKMFLEISQNSQENTCDRVSCLIKLLASGFSYRTLTFQFWLLQRFFYNISFSITIWKKCMKDLKTLN